MNDVTDELGLETPPMPDAAADDAPREADPVDAGLPDAAAPSDAPPPPDAPDLPAAGEGAPEEDDDEEDLRPKPTKAKWYIVHTYSGFEQRVEKTIREMMRTEQAKGAIKEVVVPMEKVSERAKGGEKRTTNNKIYPGYVMVRMVIEDTPDGREAWHLVQSIPKVTGFVGGKNRPTPMKDSEADHILSQMKISEETPRPKFNFERGDEVSVTDGPFAGFNGIVEDVNYDKEKLRVSVSIFGRQTPVELDFSQVSKG